MEKPKTFQKSKISAKSWFLPVLLTTLVLAGITLINLSFLVEKQKGFEPDASRQQQVGTEANDRNMIFALSGEWIASRGGAYLEEWKNDDDTLMVGAGCTLKNGLKSIVEKLAIVAEPTGYYYLATVSGQNEGRTIRFGPAVFSVSEMVFQNLKHDFPNILRYYFENDSTLLVSVESVTDTSMNFVLNLKKIKSFAN